jgi:excisionase family DNA binding protein
VPKVRLVRLLPERQHFDHHRTTSAIYERNHLREDDYMTSMGVHELGPMLTASEVASLLHLHVNTVKRLGDRGELPFYRVCKRGDRRFRLDDVMTFLSRNR